MCSIHDSFNKDDPKSHNCIGCNFAEYTYLLKRALEDTSSKYQHEAFSRIVHYSYLLVERFEEVFRIIQLPEGYRKKHFEVLGSIRRWANFFKHPKAFILVHHPQYYFETEVQIESQDRQDKIIVNQEFIDKYYSGDKENGKLYALLTNKKDVYVVFPNPVALIKDFCTAQKKFIDLISKNEVFREMLDQKTTFKNYYESLDEDDADK